MRYRYCLISILSFVFLSLPVAAGNDKKIVTVSVSVSTKPYVFDNGKGLISDVIKEAFAGSDYQPVLIRLTNREAIEKFNRGDLGALGVGNNHVVDGYLSEIYVTFNNMAITLSNAQWQIDQLEDLTGKRVIAFSEAKKYLGPNYFDVVSKLKNYTEVSPQTLQVLALFAGEADVVIADRLIFKYHLQQLLYESTSPDYYLRKINYHTILPPTEYRVVFRDSEVRDAFNKGLQRLKQSGRFQYLENYYQSLINLY